MNGQLTNQTGETLLVYGPKAPGETFDNTLYRLPTGRKTKVGWDCDGFYVPNDRKANQTFSLELGPAAVKYRDYRSPVIKSSVSGTYDCYLNDGVYKSGTINWSIPNISSKDITVSYPEAPGHLKA